MVDMGPTSYREIDVSSKGATLAHAEKDSVSIAYEQCAADGPVDLSVAPPPCALRAEEARLDACMRRHGDWPPPLPPTTTTTG
jgi:hypothetical protein